MTSKSHKKVDKKGREEEWSWEETPEVTKALAALRASEAQRKLKELGLDT